ncbi:hypothetical protein E2C01_014392 [Portunus trituberculatus]|uniref:Uncharacterized protein n=1 Tax=Portunus trituberculatus TaxID=210409 RepID=A0A5B7DKC6_PORTR|nr:hypothetical protein [Portunus trituberculatus]
MLLDTGSSRSCFSLTSYSQNKHKLGSLQHTSSMQGADEVRLAVRRETQPLRVKILTHEHNAILNGGYDQIPKVLYPSDSINMPPNC